MDELLEGDRLLVDIAQREQIGRDLDRKIKIAKREHRQNALALFRLKKQAGHAQDRPHPKFDGPTVDEALGIEWVSFDRAVRYGFFPSGPGWFLLMGRHIDVKADRFAFFFHMDLSPVSCKLLRSYAPNVRIRQGYKEVYCSDDICGALTLARLVKKPKRIVWEGRTKNPPICTRYHVLRSTKGIKIARKLKVPHGAG